MPSSKTTHAADAMADHPAAPSTVTAHTPDGTITSPRPANDVFDLTELDKSEMGIKANESFTWIRRSNIWSQFEMSDRFYEFRKSHPGARIPLDKNGDERFNGDTVLVTYPREQEQARENALIAGANQFMGEVGNHPGAFNKDDYTNADIKEQSYRNREANVALGITGPGSPTSGISYLQALKRYTAEEIKAEEAQYRSLNQHVDYNKDQWRKDMEQFHKESRRSVFGFSNSGFDRKPLNISANDRGKTGARQASSATRGGS